MERKWWKEAVGYQIYPRSFNDSNGDGIGDIPGIIEKLDYLSNLGINLIWLCPLYDSPMDDNGYDISDYYNVAQIFGTIEDMKNLLAEAKKRDIKVVMDLVLNHTSDEHPWFVEARSSKDNPYRDYYIWQEGRESSPTSLKEPNNWASFFTPSCWELDEKTGEYYMHIFSKKMPDLNWQNKAMREELYQMALWWLDLGLDGFRLDAINHIDKDWTFSDSEMVSKGPYKEDWQKFSNHPLVNHHLQEMHSRLMQDRDVFTVGELGGQTSIEEIMNYSAYDRNELDMVFTFDHCFHVNVYDALEKDWKKALNLVSLKQVFNKWQTTLYKKAWNPLYWLNHDHPRAISQYGSLDHHKASGKMLATTLLFLRGTPFIFNGEEIGMTNSHYKSLNDYRDVATLNKIKLLRQEGHTDQDILHFMNLNSRDNARTPFQWDDSKHGGFTTGTPWIPVNVNKDTINAKMQLEDPDSILNHYKKVIHLRRHSEWQDVMVYGSFKLLMEDSQSVFAYERDYQGKKLLVVSNFTDQTLDFDYDLSKVKDIIISNYAHKSLTTRVLKPFESVVYAL